MSNGAVRDVARVTVELASPLSVGSGAWDDLMDSPFALDASGLPTIPGTSLVGALRSRWVRENGPEDAKELFGFQEQGSQAEEDGAASLVDVSFAAIHDAENRPVGCRLSLDEIERDPVLRLARLAVVRPHVRINHLGTADATGRGLFDRSQVAVGHRFTFELSLRGGKPTDLVNLLAILESASFRLGARSRAGLGRLELRAIRRRRFDLCQPKDYDDFCRLPVDLHDIVPDDVLLPLPVGEVRAAARSAATATTCTLTLTPRGFWLIGGGRSNDDAGTSRPADIAPYNEPQVVWSRNVGGREIGEVDWAPSDFPVPASGIKGALRHRTAYHLNRLNKRWALDGDDPTKLADFDGLRHPAVCRLFGEALVHSGEDLVEQGNAGRVWIDEIRPVPAGSTRIAHVALDRYTSAPIDGALFEEEALWKSADNQPWQLVVRIEAAAPGEDDGPEVRRALSLALGDLAESALQLGSGYGRGNGWFEGRLEWNDPSGWMGQEEIQDGH